MGDSTSRRTRSRHFCRVVQISRQKSKRIPPGPHFLRNIGQLPSDQTYWEDWVVESFYLESVEIETNGTMADFLANLLFTEFQKQSNESDIEVVSSIKWIQRQL